MSTQPEPKTLVEAIRYFSDFDNCIAMRWPNGVTCPTCDRKDVRFIAPYRRWECKSKHPQKQFTAKVGTIFEDSPISLDKWFTAVWIITNCKNGVSSCEIARDLGVMQKTAWFMLHRIRYAMRTGTFEKMSGQIEADETYIGGLARNMHKDKKAKKITGTGGSGKAIVMGLLERHGIDKSQKIIDTIETKEKKASRVRAKVIQNTQKETLHSEVKENVQPGSELFTDALATYRGLDPEYVHQFVDHAEAYVKDQVVHTNGLENFWSLLKRGIKGTYVSVEPFHLTRYVDEQAFRFNERKLTDGERFTEVLSGVAGKRLTYKHLTGKDSESPVA
jgi:transposase-like protein